MKSASFKMHADHFGMKNQPGLTDAAYYSKLNETCRRRLMSYFMFAEKRNANRTRQSIPWNNT